MDKMIAHFNKQKADFLKKTNFDLYNKNITFEFSENNNKESIANVYINKNQKLKIKYEVIGYYNAPLNTFTWAWANPFIEKNLIQSSIDIKNEINNDKKANEIYQYIVNQPTLYLDNKSITGLFGMCLYYSDDGIFVLENITGLDRVEFILVKDIVNIS